MAWSESIVPCVDRSLEDVRTAVFDHGTFWVLALP